MDAVAAGARSLQCAAQTRAALHALKRDVALSFRICARDFGVLGRELLAALDAKQQRERNMALALEHERAARLRAQAKLTDVQGGLRVMCRVRPLLTSEEPALSSGEAGDNNARADASARLSTTRVQVPSAQDIQVFASGADGAAFKSFSFDRVFPQDTTQQQLYKEVAPLVAAAVDGQHACVFAYGQTGAGKTHTMVGALNDADRGLVFRATETVFELVAEQRRLFDFSVTVQIVEIYNEEMYDLLGNDDAASPTGSGSGGGSAMVMPFQTNAIAAHGPSFVSRRPLGEIRHGERGVYLRNVLAVDVHSAADVVAAVEQGERNRAVIAPTSTEHSSRSHCVLMLEIQRASRVDGTRDSGRLALVDLAGSERLNQGDVTSGLHLREAQHINKSLAAIGDVMAALLAKEKHVPYRNSKLTHLLQESLGSAMGHTLLLVHVSPCCADVNETTSSLKFASRVSHLQSANTRRSERVELNRLHGIIASQSAQLEALQEKLAGELELRRKYEKRLEEYRQEEHRRKAKDEEKSRREYSASTPQAKQKPSLVVGSASKATASTRVVATPEQPFATRRWSLYGRKDTFTSSSSGPPARIQTSGGQENISENILRSRSPAVRALPPVPEKSMHRSFPTVNFGLSTPLRRSRRLSLISSDRKLMCSPQRTTPHSSKRKTGTPAEVRSILKKQRFSIEQSPASTPIAVNGAKQVSFDLTSRVGARIGGVQLLPLGNGMSLPPRQPASLLRTPMNASRVPTPAARVRASPTPNAMTSPASRVRSGRSPGHAKPKWNGGWR